LAENLMYQSQMVVTPNGRFARFPRSLSTKPPQVHESVTHGFGHRKLFQLAMQPIQRTLKVHPLKHQRLASLDSHGRENPLTWQRTVDWFWPIIQASLKWPC
jgi:hypothetical protein